MNAAAVDARMHPAGKCMPSASCAPPMQAKRYWRLDWAYRIDQPNNRIERVVEAASENEAKALILEELKDGSSLWHGFDDILQTLPDAKFGEFSPLLGDFPLPLIDPARWDGEPVPVRHWALADYIPAGQVSYLTGAGATGKSLLGQQLATCIALGCPLLGVETRQGTALYLTCEDDSAELHRRQGSIGETLGAPLVALSGKLHLTSLFGEIGNELVTFAPSGKMAIEPAWERLRATVLTIGATFIVLDNTAHLFAGNENIRNQVAAFYGLLNRLADEAGAAILLIGHPNKAGAEFSGSTAWENQVRSRLFLETPTAEDGSAIDPDARVLTRGKSNYARKGGDLPFRWHRGAFVRDTDLPANVAAELAEIVLANGDNAIFLTCLDERNRQERAVSESPASRTFAPKVFAEMAESKRIGRARLGAALDRLFRIGAIERGFVYRDASEGKDRSGLRRRSADLSADLPLTGSADVPLTTRRPPLAHTTPLKGGTGAATLAAAPANQDNPDDQ